MPAVVLAQGERADVPGLRAPHPDPVPAGTPPTVRRLTNRATGYKGPTELIHARVRPEIAEFIRDHVGTDGLGSKSDIVQDALALWCLREERGEQLPPTEPRLISQSTPVDLTVTPQPPVFAGQGTIMIMGDESDLEDLDA